MTYLKLTSRYLKSSLVRSYVWVPGLRLMHLNLCTMDKSHAFDCFSYRNSTFGTPESGHISTPDNGQRACAQNYLIPELWTNIETTSKKLWEWDQAFEGFYPDGLSSPKILLILAIQRVFTRVCWFSFSQTTTFCIKKRITNIRIDGLAVQPLR